MHRVGTWSSVVVLASCAARPEPAPEPPLAPLPAPSATPAAAARASACRAEPSTVYGDELVTFEVLGDGRLRVEAFDARAEPVFRSEIELPGRVQLPDLPSGDFRLTVVGSNVACEVTVNRELSRATPAPR